MGKDERHRNSERAVVCPYCGYQDAELAADLLEESQDGVWIVRTECDNCEQPIRIEFSVNLSTHAPYAPPGGPA